MPLCSVEEALEDLKAGKFVIVVDDEQRENEGDLVMPAEMVTPEAVNFMVGQARGLLCMPVMGERLDELNIPLMIGENFSSKHQTAFTVSVDYNKGTTTGISAQDRTASILAMIDGVVPPTLNLDDPDDGCDIDLVPHQSKQRRVSTVLSNSFGFGGTNASLVLTRAP